MHERRGKFREASYVGQPVNPTMNQAVSQADPKRSAPRPGFPPMKIERLLASGCKLSDEDQVRVLYHQLGDVGKVAKQIGQSEAWVQDVCAWDIEHRTA